MEVLWLLKRIVFQYDQVLSDVAQSEGHTCARYKRLRNERYMLADLVGKGRAD